MPSLYKALFYNLKSWKWCYAWHCFVGRGVDGEAVTGMIHGRVELRGHYRQSLDVLKVEWKKYAAENSTSKLLYVATFSNSTNICIEPCQNIDLQNKSFILFNLKKSDEGIYEEVINLKNSTILRFNYTLSVLCEKSTSASPTDWANNTSPVSNENRTSTAHCNFTGKICVLLL